MVRVRVMRMRMPDRLVHVPMRVRLAGRILRTVRVPQARAEPHQQAHFLKRTCPDLPAAVFKVTLMVAAALIGFLASPSSEYPPCGVRLRVSRSDHR